MLVSDLITRIRSITDQPSQSFVTDAQLLDWINAEAAELHGLKTTLYEDYYTGTPTTFTVTSGNTITLPTDFFKIRRLEYYVNAGDLQYTPLERTSLPEMQKFNHVLYASGLYTRRAYVLLDSKVYVLPELAATGTYRLWYARNIDPFTTTGDTVTEPEGHEEYVIYGVALRVREKENVDGGEFMAKKLALKTRIEGEASNRDASQPAHVVDMWDDSDY